MVKMQKFAGKINKITNRQKKKKEANFTLYSQFPPPQLGDAFLNNNSA